MGCGKSIDGGMAMVAMVDIVDRTVMEFGYDGIHSLKGFLHTHCEP